MTDAILGWFGPLTKPECLRASRRGWLVWLRLIPAVGAGSVVFLVTWFWATMLDFDSAHLPYYELRVGLTAIAGGLVALAALIPPAVLAGSLAGEKERGSIGLLLSTQATAADIVLSRWIARLAPVGLVAAAALPLLLGMAAVAGLNPPVVLMLIVLPLVVGLGGGGFALGVSAVSKRGRDALLLIYLVEVVLTLGSLFATPLGGGTNQSMLAYALGVVGLGAFNPFGALGPLIWGEQVWPAVATTVLWAIMGLVGLGVACWRLRPSCLNDGSGSNRNARRFRRSWGHRVPPVGTRPMLWKELHIERAGSLGRVGRWIGAGLVLWLGLGSLILGGLVALEYSRTASGATVAGRTPAPSALPSAPVVTTQGLTVNVTIPQASPTRASASFPGSEPWAVSVLASWYGGSALLISFLIQWAIGLRAGVAIASERERGTWDGLLTSPLDGAEIVRGKLWGSLHALRWLIGSALLAWTITWAVDGMTNRQYFTTLAETATWSVLMAAAGVAFSLRTATATRAMGATLAGWLGAFVGLKLIAIFVCLLVMLVCLFAWLSLIQLGFVDAAMTPWFPMSFSLGMEWVFCVATMALAAAIIAETRLRFDRVAGRMTGGATAVAIDKLLHGRPMAPVRLGKGAQKAGAMADWEAEMLAPPAG